MPSLRLKKHVVVPAYPNSYRVILTMDDGFDLDVGGIEESVAAGPERFWAWSAPGAAGRSETRDAAMEDFRSAWSAVSDDTLAAIRHEQEWTANKYALWAAGYRDQLGKGQIKCRCGEMFDAGDHAETMAHIGHITGRPAGT